MGPGDDRKQPDGEQTEAQPRILFCRTKHLQQKYRIKEALYRGEMSSVRRCYQRSDRKDFAMKIIRVKRRKKTSSKRNQIIESWKKQIPILQALRHENICK